jgi:hypothetical protein
MAESPLIGSTAAEALAHHEQRLPAALRPNRGPNFTWVLAFLGFIGFALYNLYFDQSLIIAYKVEQTPATGDWIGRHMPLLAFVVFAGICGFAIWREFAYFRSDGAFFLGLSRAGVTMSTPFARRHFAWQDLERFRVGVGRERTRYGSRQSYSVRADLKNGSWLRSGVVLGQSDFARDLGADKAASAEILCVFLNEVRDRVREAEREGRDVVVPAPYGLVVVETPSAGYGPPKPATAVDEASVERPRTERVVINRKPTVSRE